MLCDNVSLPPVVAAPVVSVVAVVSVVVVADCGVCGARVNPAVLASLDGTFVCSFLLRDSVSTGSLRAHITCRQHTSTIRQQ